MAAPFEDWDRADLADALRDNDEFFDEVLAHRTEEDEEEWPLEEWDRYDLVQYAYDYLKIENDESNI